MSRHHHYRTPPKAIGILSLPRDLGRLSRNRVQEFEADLGYSVTVRGPEADSNEQFEHQQHAAQRIKPYVDENRLIVASAEHAGVRRHEQNGRAAGDEINTTVDGRLSVQYAASLSEPRIVHDGSFTRIVGGRPVIYYKTAAVSHRRYVPLDPDQAASVPLVEDVPATLFVNKQTGVAPTAESAAAEKYERRGSVNLLLSAVAKSLAEISSHLRRGGASAAASAKASVQVNLGA